MTSLIRPSSLACNSFIVLGPAEIRAICHMDQGVRSGNGLEQRGEWKGALRVKALPERAPPLVK